MWDRSRTTKEVSGGSRCAWERKIVCVHVVGVGDGVCLASRK